MDSLRYITRCEQYCDVSGDTVAVDITGVLSSGEPRVEITISFDGSEDDYHVEQRLRFSVTQTDLENLQVALEHAIEAIEHAKEEDD